MADEAIPPDTQPSAGVLLPGEPKSTKVSNSTAAERWLDELEREWVILSATMSGAAGGKIEVTVRVKPRYPRP